MEEIYKSEDFRQKTLLAKKLNYYSNRVHEIHYSDLTELIANNELTPGMQYRIIDYQTTVDQDGCSTDGRLFDVIVTALTSNTLDENARCCATNRTQTNTQSLGNPAGWKIKYAITNPSWCAWVSDTEIYKGTIYYMEDEFGNEAYYDFKTIVYTTKYADNTNSIIVPNILGAPNGGVNAIMRTAVNNFEDSAGNLLIHNTTRVLKYATNNKYTFNVCTDYNTYDSDAPIESSGSGLCINNRIQISEQHKNFTNKVYLPKIIICTTNTVQNNTFINCTNSTICECWNTANTTGSGNIKTVDNGIISSNNFTDCDNLYIYGSRLYTNTFCSCSKSAYICYGSYYEQYMYKNTFISGNDNCVFSTSAIKDNYIGMRVNGLRILGAGTQDNRFESVCSNINWICDVSTNGYLLYNTFGQDCSNITINCPWFFRARFFAGAKNIKITKGSGTHSFNTPVTNILINPGYYGTNTAQGEFSLSPQTEVVVSSDKTKTYQPTHTVEIKPKESIVIVETTTT